MVAVTLPSIGEIVGCNERKFVVLDHCRFDAHGRLTHGRILAAGTDRDEVYDTLRSTPNSVIIFTGPDWREREGAFLDSGQAYQSVATC